MKIGFCQKKLLSIFIFRNFDAHQMSKLVYYVNSCYRASQKNTLCCQFDRSSLQNRNTISIKILEHTLHYLVILTTFLV